MSEFNEPIIVTDEINPAKTEKAENVNIDTPQKKKGRGRPKKTEKPAGVDSRAGNSVETKPTNEADELSALRNEYGKNTVTFDVPDNNPETEKKINSVLSGYMLLMVCDFVFPTLIVMFFKRKKPNLKVGQLKLTDTEKREMADLADEAAKHLVTGLSPLQLFFIGMGAIYMGKLQDVKD